MTARKVALGVAFAGWLYGVPFLIIAAGCRWLVHLDIPKSQASAFGSGTNRLLIVALLLDFVLPVAGTVAAHLLREHSWRRHFQVALAGAVVYLVVIVGVLGLSVRSLPAVPTPKVSHCVQYSGEPASCPGG